MAMSTADYFRMMQGGVDRTGYADMIPDVEKKEESLEDRLAKLMEAMGEEDTPPEDTPPEETGGLSFGGDFLNSALLGLFTPSLPGKIAALTGGMNFSSNFGKDYVDEIKEKVDPENTMGDVSEMDDDFLFGLGNTSKMTLKLQSSTTYEYYMKAWYCGGSSSGWSALQNFTTEDECQNVTNFTVSTPTTTKAGWAKLSTSVAL